MVQGFLDLEGNLRLQNGEKGINKMKGPTVEFQIIKVLTFLIFLKHIFNSISYLKTQNKIMSS